MHDPNKNGSGESEVEVNFSVMPSDVRGDNLVSDDIVVPPPQTFDAQQTNSQQVSAEVSDYPADHHSMWKNKWTYIIGGVLIFATLGGIAYFLLGKTPAELTMNNSQAASKLPKVFLQRYFSTDVCEDKEVCGEEADPDKDGLNNYQEFVEQTDPKLNDSDDDGLADGDEVYIYLTLPIKKFTDSRAASVEQGYHDGSQIKNEYDPLTPGMKMTDVRKKQIAMDKESYGLHEPTMTTMAKASAPLPKTVSVSIINGKFDANSLTISVNDTVIWVNKDVATHQIASDPHPTHTNLPDLESGILATNQTFSFKFKQAGTYTYHDHINPTIKGTIIVK
jgi:plastocyanin